MRERRLWQYKAWGRPQADYYEDVFSRWVSIHGPEIAFPPRMYVSVVRQNTPASMLSLETSEVLGKVAKRIASCIVTSPTERAFTSRVYCHFSDILVAYVRGVRYAIGDASHRRRFDEMFLLYAILGPSSVIDSIESGLSAIMETT